MARHYNVSLVLESPTWRANSDWGAQLGYDQEAMSAANHQAIALLHIIRQRDESWPCLLHD